MRPILILKRRASTMNLWMTLTNIIRTIRSTDGQSHHPFVQLAHPLHLQKLSQWWWGPWQRRTSPPWLIVLGQRRPCPTGLLSLGRISSQAIWPAQKHLWIDQLVLVPSSNSATAWKDLAEPMTMVPLKICPPCLPGPVLSDTRREVEARGKMQLALQQPCLINAF